MADELTIFWEGKAGRKYKYWIYEIGHSMKKVPGNYCFAKEVEPHKWGAIYFGETGDLSERFDNHHKIACIKRHGATHIHTHTSSLDEDVRRAEEADLVARLKPICND